MCLIILAVYVYIYLTFAHASVSALVHDLIASEHEGNFERKNQIKSELF